MLGPGRRWACVLQGRLLLVKQLHMAGAWDAPRGRQLEPAPRMLGRPGHCPEPCLPKCPLMERCRECA